MALIEIRGLSKSFGEVKAVAGVDLDINAGEFITLLGPSGSGKTTVLRMIAGFEDPDAGTIKLNGEDITHLPPYDRDVNTVFQDYALFPHMDVITNIEYGLRVKKVNKEERRKKALEALEQVRLSGYEKRKPSQLSGGQRQRVALARALVNRPSVLLLDEPLGALDLKLRQQMQIELKELQREVGITFIFVTHDQEEALTMSDRIAVFDKGKIQQLDRPAAIYEKPVNEFVAGFVGVSNLITGNAAQTLLGKSGTFTVRPEKIQIDKAQGAAGTVKEVEYLGPSTRFIVDLDAGARLVVLRQNTDESAVDVMSMRGKKVNLSWAKESEYRVN
ncbi:MAG: ABC transporter ATP-binding protein [Actinomycetales bacterium]|nr:ABC transporter ATP-binding protein [Actinomycetales bacterium]